MKYIPLLVVVMLFANCRPTENSCVAGTGGHTNIVSYARRADTLMLNFESPLDTAYVKYNSLLSPGNDLSKYDTFIVSEPGENHIHIQNLKCGNYFVLRIAWDSATHTRYTGSLGINIKGDGGEIDTNFVVN